MVWIFSYLWIIFEFHLIIRMFIVFIWTYFLYSCIPRLPRFSYHWERFLHVFKTQQAPLYRLLAHVAQPRITPSLVFAPYIALSSSPPSSTPEARQLLNHHPPSCRPWSIRPAERLGRADLRSVVVSLSHILITPFPREVRTQAEPVRSYRWDFRLWARTECALEVELRDTAVDPYVFSLRGCIGFR